MRKALALVATTLILLVGCATGEKMSSLRPGMTKAEAERVLGRPDGFEASGSQEAYKYSKRLMSGWSWDQADYVLLFENDRLVKYGPGTIYPREWRSNTHNVNQNVNIRWQ
jgi:hypothetical protein